MQSPSFGIREAKINLSRILKMIRNGGEVILTDRGRPVGKIVPIQAESVPLTDRIRKLEEMGMIEPDVRRSAARSPFPIPVPDDVAQAFLREDRGNG